MVKYHKMKSILSVLCLTLALTLTLACGQEPVPTPTPTSAPAETSTPVPPTSTPVAGPVAASNIPMPTRAPIITPTPGPTRTPSPTRTPVSLEFAIFNSARDFTAKAGGGYAFNMSGVLSVQTSDRIDVDIPITYAGDALPGYNSATLSLTTPSETVEYDAIALHNMAGVSGETIEAGYIFDADAHRWAEKEELLLLSALASLSVLLGSDLSETSDIATDGQVKLTGQETFDGVETHVISGKVTGAETELEVTYRIGVDDVLLRQIEVSGNLDPSVIGALTDGISADSARAELTVSFSDYGKDVVRKSPYLAWPRFSHNATLLDDGRVLVSGGWMGAFEDNNLTGFPAGISQIYDPLTATWTFKGKLDPDAWEEIPDLFPQTSPARLPDGRIVSVAILGDPHPHPPDIDVHPFGALAVFDTDTDEWTRLSDTPVPTDRSFPDAIVLSDGRVLVVGGTEIGRSASASFSPLGIVEAYDPSTDTWQTLEPMNRVAIQRWLVPLDDGRILAAGGFIIEPDMQWASEVEIYDPHTNKWTPAESMTAPHTQAIVLLDSRVLATGGALPHTDIPDSETYDPATGEWTAAGAMSQRRSNHTLTLLTDGRVLAVGGVNATDNDDYAVLPTTEIYDPATNTWSPGPELSQPRASHSATLMPDGSVLLTGGISERNGDKYVSISTEFIGP